MKKRLKQAGYWLLNFFNFSRPIFLELEYVDYVIANKAYLLVSWKSEHMYCLNIKELHYTSFQKTASAYIAIPTGVNEVQIKILNSWHSCARQVKFKRTVLSGKLDYELCLNSDQLNKDRFIISSPRISFKKMVLKPFFTKIKRPDKIKIVNLNYP